MDGIPYYNEACANCGIPADLHLGPDDPPRDSPESTWGDLNRCRDFKRCDPPRPAYGPAWWSAEGLGRGMAIQEPATFPRLTREDLTRTVVMPDDTRPLVGPADQCGYCESPLGEEHEADCVCRKRPVLIELRIRMVVDRPESWGKEDIEFQINEGSYCAGNLIHALAESDNVAGEWGCCDSCARTEAEFIRPATDEDIEFDALSAPPLPASRSVAAAMELFRATCRRVTDGDESVGLAELEQAHEQAVEAIRSVCRHAGLSAPAVAAGEELLSEMRDAAKRIAARRSATRP